MSKIKVTKVEIDKATIRDHIRKSQEMRNIVEGYGNRIAISAGEGYETKSRMLAEEASVIVYPATKEARQDNFDNNTLFRLIGL